MPHSASELPPHLVSRVLAGRRAARCLTRHQSFLRISSAACWPAAEPRAASLGIRASSASRQPRAGQQPSRALPGCRPSELPPHRRQPRAGLAAEPRQLASLGIRASVPHLSQLRCWPAAEPCAAGSVAGAAAGSAAPPDRRPTTSPARPRSAPYCRHNNRVGMMSAVLQQSSGAGTTGRE